MSTSAGFSGLRKVGIRMYADPDRLLRGSNHTYGATDHVQEACNHLRSVEVTAGMFGQTEAATNAEAVTSRAHQRHTRALDDHHRNLTWIGENTAGAATALGGADHAGADAVRRGDAVDP
ncbi:DUF2563 family protein [Nocardia sp. NPDC050630]|uniref:DUF2563 family protein n=1 Tax=Nocardia sp. NPDC050630 TaxID=3364321 RepID=UPI00379E7B21